MWLKMIYLISSMSDHGKCTIKLRLSVREFINVYFGNFQWLPWQRVESSQKQQKISISLIFKSDLSQVNTPVDISMVNTKLPCS